jgi:peptide/nickel transport system substrate-binding protein
MKRLIFVLLGLILLLSLLLGACGKTTPITPTTPTALTTPTTPPTTPTVDKHGGIFRQAFTTGLTTPIGYPPEATPDSAQAAGPALEALIEITQDGTIVPLLATSWTVANDGKSITLNLRQGVKFHDGSDFNAEVCKWNLDTEIEAKRAMEWQSVDIVDDYTIRINIPGYKNTTLTNLSGSYTQQISKATFDEKGIEYSRWHPVGTGPFIFVDYERDAKLTYKRNPNYWEPGVPYLDGLEWTVIADATVRKMAFQRGDISRLDAQAMEAKELKDAGFPLATSQGGTFVVVPCSTVDESPWSNLKVRQAASYALNREALADALGFGFAVPAYQLYPNDSLSNIPNLVKTEYNPEKAKQLLAEAGYPNGFDAKIHTHTMIVPSDWINAVAAQLREVGINAEVDFPEVGKFMSDATNGWSDGLMAGAFINMPSNPNYILEMYLKGYFYGSWKRTDVVMNALDASLASPKPDSKLIQMVLQKMNDEVSLIPYVAQINATFYQEGVHDEGAAKYGEATFVLRYLWLDLDLR